MKLTNRAFILLIFVLFISRESFSQENKYSISALIGTAAYSWPTYGGGGLAGTNYSLSGGIQLTDGLALAFQADYSSFGIIERSESEISVSYKPNPIHSYSLEIIPKWGGINISLGAGWTYQNADAVVYHYYNSTEGRAYTEQSAAYEGVDTPKFHGLLGFGGDIKLIKELSLVVQTRLFKGQDYFSWFLETGLKYKF